MEGLPEYGRNEHYKYKPSGQNQSPGGEELLLVTSGANTTKLFTTVKYATVFLRRSNLLLPKSRSVSLPYCQL